MKGQVLRDGLSDQDGLATKTNDQVFATNCNARRSGSSSTIRFVSVPPLLSTNHATR